MLLDQAPGQHDFTNTYQLLQESSCTHDVCNVHHTLICNLHCILVHSDRHILARNDYHGLVHSICHVLVCPVVDGDCANGLSELRLAQQGRQG